MADLAWLKRVARVVLLWVSLASVCVAAENWPQFRGPGGRGLSAERGLPARWGEGRGVRWKTPLPGPGHSSPVVWGERVFLTAYAPPKDNRPGRLLVLCLNADTGRVLWEREAPAARIERTGGANAPASPTPATDGRRLYVYFGSYGLLCFDLDGRKLWDVPLGPFANEWGSASSPVLHGRLLLLNRTHEEGGFLLAVNKETGRTVWRTEHPRATPSFATPFVWEKAGGAEIVVSGSGYVKGFDPRTGRELWRLGGMPDGVAPTPVSAHGLLYVASNSQPNFILAVRPGGRGDVTRTHVAWRHDRAVISVPSPLVVGAHLYALRDGGIMTCLDAKTGSVVWQQRLPGRGNYFASPVAGDGKIYAVSEEGEVAVVAAGPVHTLLASNRMGERTMASPAVAGSRILIRTDENLYCVEGVPEGGAAQALSPM